MHGGDIYRNHNCIDFSASINPLGMPESVKLALKNSIEKCIYYPDIKCEKLIQTIAEKEKVNCKNIICGNGAADLIFSICLARKPKNALIFSPTFSEYEQALLSVNCKIEFIDLDEKDNFKINSNILNKITRYKCDIIFICNPNNPTGQLIEFEYLKQLAKYCFENDIFLVVDECFLDFIDNFENYSANQLLEKYNNIFILKAFTKIYAMAGIRLGYGICSDYDFISKIHFVTQPWSVSVLAQEAGIAALNENEFIIKTRKFINNQRKFLLSNMKYLAKKIYGSSANYIFFKSSKNLDTFFLNNKILIRDCSNYRGLEKGYYRIAIRNKNENEKLIHTWKSKEN